MIFAFDWHYSYMFPIAILICALATSSGFSGSVLFQPVYYFIARVPLAQSIATGIATETVGMTTGAFTYLTMKRKLHTNGSSMRINFQALLSVLPFVLMGVIVGYYVFLEAPRPILRLIVGVVIAFIALYQLRASSIEVDQSRYKFLDKLRVPRSRFYQFIAGAFSACTGTGVAEMHQPLFEQKAFLGPFQSNATAICLEAIADWLITCFNLRMGNLRYDILIFTVSGVLVGGQIGPRIARYIPPRSIKVCFGIAVILIGLVYIITSLPDVFDLLLAKSA